MKYFKVEWKQDHPDEPIWLYYEVDHKNNEVRRVEEYRDGHMGYVSAEASHLAFRAEAPLPPIDEINRNPEFDAKEIQGENSIAFGTKQFGKRLNSEECTTQDSCSTRVFTSVSKS